LGREETSNGRIFIKGIENMKFDKDFLQLVKTQTLKALLSDDNIMEQLVFKGGNAIAMIYKLQSRSSIDLDFSMAQDFDSEEKKYIQDKIKILLEKSFEEVNYNVVNFNFEEKPRVSINEYWGGYEISFQLIDKKRFSDLPTHSKEILGRNSKVIYDDKKKFTIDISKYEYCSAKKSQKFEGYKIYVYTIEMIVFEKLRSICQQTEEYQNIVKCSITSRARDFFDIYNLIENCKIDISTPENLELLKAIFDAKNVPLKLILGIKKYYNFHNESFDSLKETVEYANLQLKDFNFYFSYLIKKVENLKDKIVSKFPKILD